jgi:hypothetical protein
VESGECVFTGSQLDDSWLAVFKDSSRSVDPCKDLRRLNNMPEHFDDTHVIGLSGDMVTNPKVYIRNTHAVMRDGNDGVLHVLEHRPYIHFLERRPV